MSAAITHTTATGRIANILSKDILFIFKSNLRGELDPLVVERSTDITDCYVISAFLFQWRRKYS